MDLIIFDLAGTTLQIGDLVPVAFHETFKEHGIQLDGNEIIGIRGLSKLKAIEMLLMKHLVSSSKKRTDILYQNFMKLLEEKIKQEVVPVVPGSEETFQWLKEKLCK